MTATPAKTPIPSQVDPRDYRIRSGRRRNPLRLRLSKWETFDRTALASASDADCGFDVVGEGL